ncbi:MAG: HAMP domain-containing sensor histidine kinase [Candidatus Coprenecus sp.]|nr:HAMP domain-containing sensor histidine kinase [Candidatus Coprenecus sp.]
MDRLKLFHFIEDNHIFAGVGSFFLVVDEELQIHFIKYDPVNQDAKLCVGDYLKCSNSLNAADGCGCHENCPLCSLRTLVQASIRESKRMEGDVTMLVENNRDYSAHVISTPFSEDGKDYSILLLVDQTALMREQMLERVFCHDLLNLSGALNGMLECIDDSNQEEMRAILKSISVQMMEQIKSQRDLIYAIQGMLKPEKTIFKASEIIDFVKDSLVHVAIDVMNVNVVIDSRLSEEYIQSDKVLVNRVIHNMFKNACEANCGGDVIVRAWAEGEKVVYSVHNDLVMTPSVKSKIFIQGNTTKKSGHGLGTYGMKLIGENYLGGTVRFRSEEGFGTDFYFELDKFSDK